MNSKKGASFRRKKMGKVGKSCITPVTSVRNLGSWFDENMNVMTYTNNISKTASFHLYNIRSIRKYLTNNTTQTLVHAIIMGRIDYYGVPLRPKSSSHKTNKMKRVQTLLNGQI